MVRLPALAILAALAAPAAAQDAVAADEFDRLATGRTLHFTLNGLPFGSEQFFSGRRSLWRFAGQECQPGTWHGEGERICFVYDADPTPICWFFRRDDGEFSAHLAEDGGETGFSLELSAIDSAPLPCPGPEVGS